MHKVVALLCIVYAQMLFSKTTGPWFTGPLLAEPALTVEPGHVNIELLDFDTHSSAVYSNESKVTPVLSSVNNQVIPEITIGVAHNIDVELQPLLISNEFQGKSATSLGDTTIILGIQALRQKSNTFKPDLRITLDQILPSGHYEQLSQQNYALNATGLGSYQTGLDFNFQKLTPLRHDYYLNTHVNIGYLYASAVHIKGYSIYGGSALTEGDMKPGSVYTLDLAGELSLSQHWVVVFEGLYQYQAADRFFGSYGDTDLNFPRKTKKDIKKALSRLMPTRRNISSLFLELPKVGNGTMDMASFAPAIEYNFNHELGVIVGTWFSFYGKNTIDFGALAIGVNILL